jgi:hypothetical protein
MLDHCVGLILFAGDIRSVIVFPEFYWIGSAEQNQSETPLPLPDELTQVCCVHIVWFVVSILDLNWYCSVDQCPGR